MIDVAFDTEIYRNYFLAAFKSIKSGKTLYFERSNGTPIIRLLDHLGLVVGRVDREFDRNHLNSTLRKFRLIGFNSLPFDMPIIAAALAGWTPSQLKDLADAIILGGMRPWEIERSYGLRMPEFDHIDLIEVAPSACSLKLYNGRLHGRRMQDLPIDPNAVLTPSQMEETREYCINDLDATALLFGSLEEPIALRTAMSKEYGQDLRSKSDAQIAEAVIKKRLQEVSGLRPERPRIAAGTKYRYKIPPFLSYRTTQLQTMLDEVAEADFIVPASGKIEMPAVLKKAKIQIGGSTYRMGIGGLHSSEQCVSHVADLDTVIIDRDVESFYPRLILLQDLFPKHLGPEFLKIYREIVDRRVAAKARAKAGEAGFKTIADSLKITINGAFGKLGSKWSVLFAPDLMMQVTVTGQLVLLMLIERIEGAGIPVVSANTDGVVIKCPRAREADLLAVVKEWEAETGFETEETRYSAVYSRDVNSYLAIKVPDKDGKVKVKGKNACEAPWALSDGEKPDFRRVLMKNPTNTICIEAITEFLTKGVPIERTVTACQDVTKFVTIRTVKGGAIWGGSPIKLSRQVNRSGADFEMIDVTVGLQNAEYLGKSIRWYYSTIIEGAIHYKVNGNKVARSDGARPLMFLTEEIPSDLNHRWYIEEAKEILRDIGWQQPESPALSLLRLIGAPV